MKLWISILPPEHNLAAHVVCFADQDQAQNNTRP
jgi:hypothetical protein